MKSETTHINDLLKEFKLWSETADQSEDGWQGNFPKWKALMSIAQQLMQNIAANSGDILALELCWRISEEDEDLVDFAKANFMACWPALVMLVNSPFPEVRWQIYSVLGAGGTQSITLLRNGLCDPNAYCRRRAIISLAKVLPEAQEEISYQFADDPDPLIREVARNLPISLD